jgi:hypothetical protein
MYAKEKLDYELKCAGSVSEGLHLHSWSINFWYSFSVVVEDSYILVCNLMAIGI